MKFLCLVLICFSLSCSDNTAKIDLDSIKSDSQAYSFEGDWKNKNGNRLKFIKGEVWQSGKIVAYYTSVKTNVWEISSANHIWSTFEDKKLNGYAIVKKEISELYLGEDRDLIIMSRVED